MVRTKDYSPWIGWAVGEEKHRKMNPYIKKYKDLLKRINFIVVKLVLKILSWKENATIILRT